MLDLLYSPKRPDSMGQIAGEVSNQLISSDQVNLKKKNLKTSADTIQECAALAFNALT